MPVRLPKIIVRRASFVFAVVALSESETCIAGGASIGLFSRRARISLSRDFGFLLSRMGSTCVLLLSCSLFSASLYCVRNVSLICSNVIVCPVIGADIIHLLFKLSPGVINSFLFNSWQMFIPI